MKRVVYARLLRALAYTLVVATVLLVVPQGPSTDWGFLPPETSSTGR